MEITSINYEEPRYSMRRLGIKILFIFLVSFILALVAGGIDALATGRENSGLLSKENYQLVTNSTSYCFALIFITSLTLVLLEVAFRKEINYLQYALIGCALCLFYLLLLSVSELIPFLPSFLIAALMTVALISIFVNGITGKVKTMVITTAVLTAEYALIYILASIDSMALLIGSLSMFALIALAMYFTIKLKIENNELILK